MPSSSSAREERSVWLTAPSPHKLLLVCHPHARPLDVVGSGVYYIHMLDLDVARASSGVAVERIPDPIRLIAADGHLPFGMKSVMSGTRLYLIGGCWGPDLAPSTAIYYIDLDAIMSALDAGHQALLQRGGMDMPIGNSDQLVVPVDEKIYVIPGSLHGSTLVQMFDPSDGSWFYIPRELDRLWTPYPDGYRILAYMVRDACIQVFSESGVYLFDTAYQTWTWQLPDGSGNPYFCRRRWMESSQYYVACSKEPGALVVYPKHEPYLNVDSYDVLAPYKEHVLWDHVRSLRNNFLLQVSKDRFCLVSEVMNMDEKKHIIVHTFDFLEKDVESPGYRHQDLSKVMYATDHSPWKDGEIQDVFLINHNDLGH